MDGQKCRAGVPGPVGGRVVREEREKEKVWDQRRCDCSSATTPRRTTVRNAMHSVEQLSASGLARRVPVLGVKCAHASTTRTRAVPHDTIGILVRRGQVQRATGCWKRTSVPIRIGSIWGGDFVANVGRKTWWPEKNGRSPSRNDNRIRFTTPLVKVDWSLFFYSHCCLTDGR